MRTEAFRALRPPATLAASVSSVPYDVIDTEGAFRLAAGNPRSFLHITRSEIDLKPGIDLHSDEVYAKAADNLARFEAEGVLVREEEPCFYVYREVAGAHVQRGVVACCHAADYESGTIRRHEKTRLDKEEDRKRHISGLNAHAEPVLLFYRDVRAIDRIVAGIEGSRPLYDFADPEGVEHALWKAPENSGLAEAFGDVPRCYIADGHHRCAGAVRVAAERRANNPEHSGHESYNWFPAVLFPASQLRILPYNRLVRDLNPMTPCRFLDQVGHAFAVNRTDRHAPESAGTIMMCVGDAWYELTWPGNKVRDARELDIDILQNRLLAPILDISDPRTSDRIEFVGGIRPPEELAEKVRSGQYAAAFSMYPVSTEAVMAVSDAGGIMPPKSTWFEPKLRSGLFVHTLQDAGKEVS